MAIMAPRLVLLDSITQVQAEHADRLVVTGSHGGSSAAFYAKAVRAWLYVFNDAGVGKHDAGIAALPLLQAAGIAAATVGHDSARIGEADDSWDNGVVSRLNAGAAALGLVAGQRLREQLRTT